MIAFASTIDRIFDKLTQQTPPIPHPKGVIEFVIGELEPEDVPATFAAQVKHDPDEQPPIPMIMFCPSCDARHIDKGEFTTKVHHTHACQSCGNVWRPAIVATVGVQFLPGFKDPK